MMDDSDESNSRRRDPFAGDASRINFPDFAGVFASAPATPVDKTNLSIGTLAALFPTDIIFGDSFGLRSPGTGQPPALQSEPEDEDDAGDFFEKRAAYTTPHRPARGVPKGPVVLYREGGGEGSSSRTPSSAARGRPLSPAPKTPGDRSDWSPEMSAEPPPKVSMADLYGRMHSAGPDPPTRASPGSPGVGSQTAVSIPPGSHMHIIECDLHDPLAKPRHSALKAGPAVPGTAARAARPARLEPPVSPIPGSPSRLSSSGGQGRRDVHVHFSREPTPRRSHRLSSDGDGTPPHPPALAHRPLVSPSPARRAPSLFRPHPAAAHSPFLTNGLSIGFDHDAGTPIGTVGRPPRAPPSPHPWGLSPSPPGRSGRRAGAAGGDAGGGLADRAEQLAERARAVAGVRHEPRLLPAAAVPALLVEAPSLEEDSPPRSRLPISRPRGGRGPRRLRARAPAPLPAGPAGARGGGDLLNVSAGSSVRRSLAAQLQAMAAAHEARPAPAAPARPAPRPRPARPSPLRRSLSAGALYTPAPARHAATASAAFAPASLRAGPAPSASPAPYRYPSLVSAYLPSSAGLFRHPDPLRPSATYPPAGGALARLSAALDRVAPPSSLYARLLAASPYIPFSSPLLRSGSAWSLHAGLGPAPALSSRPAFSSGLGGGLGGAEGRPGQPPSALDHFRSLYADPAPLGLRRPLFSYAY
eukprot:tig00000241_g20860.t1